MTAYDKCRSSVGRLSVPVGLLAHIEDHKRAVPPMTAHGLVWDYSSRGAPSMHHFGWCQNSDCDLAAQSSGQTEVCCQQRARIAIGNADRALHCHHHPTDL